MNDVQFELFIRKTKATICEGCKRTDNHTCWVWMHHRLDRIRLIFNDTDDIKPRDSRTVQKYLFLREGKGCITRDRDRGGL